MFEVLLSVISLIIGYLISLYFHKRNEKSLVELNKWLSENVSNSNKLFLYEDRMNKVLEAFNKKGTPLFIIESFNDLTKDEKAKMYDQACLQKKGRLGKNPFRQ